MQGEVTYSYSSKPRAVQTNRAKGRDGHDGSASKVPATNIMHDPRIFRGGSLASRALPSPVKIGATRRDSDKGKRRKSSSSRTKGGILMCEEPQKLSSYPIAAYSLDAYLVEPPRELVERDSFSQMDEFKPRTMTVKAGFTADGPFQRPKVGVDSSTQMDSSDNLFDFDVEVKPLLSVLVGKTLAQALVEVKEEQEMEFIQHQRKIMHAEKAENAREDKLLEEKSKQLQLEKEQEKQAKALKLRRRQVVTEKLMAWQLSRQIVDRSMELCTTALERKGVFYDPIQRDLAQWLASDIYKGADAKIRLQAAAYTLLDDLLDYSFQRQAFFSHVLADEDEALVRILLREPLVLNVEPTEEDERPAPVSLHVIGPVEISRRKSSAALEQIIQEWIEASVGRKVVAPACGFLSMLKLQETI